jgi:hypothetical protein
MSRSLRVLGALLLAGASVGLVLSPAAGADATTTPAFGAAPISLTGKPVAANYALSLKAGHSAAQGIALRNKTASKLTLRVSAAVGKTAPASGDAYAGAFAACSGAGCWVQGLPAAVTLRGGVTQSASFTIAVPRGTSSGQYLAGIVVEPKTGQSTTNQGRPITLRVAITVGNTAALPGHLAVTAISSAKVHSTPYIYLQEQNSGKLIARGSGRLTCTHGSSTLTYPFTSGDVLAGDSAVLPVLAADLPLGVTVNCRAEFLTASTATAAFTAAVHTPAAKNRLTSTELASIIGGGLLVIIALALLLMLRLRRNKNNGGGPGPSGPSNDGGDPDLGSPDSSSADASADNAVALGLRL